MVITLLQVANPRGSGLAAGVAALLFTAVPLAWYFVGRELATPRAMRIVFGGLVVVGCVVAVYGLNQTWNGLPRGIWSGSPDGLCVSQRRRRYPRVRDILQRRGICLLPRHRACRRDSRSRSTVCRSFFLLSRCSPSPCSTSPAGESS